MCWVPLLILAQENNYWGEAGVREAQDGRIAHRTPAFPYFENLSKSFVGLTCQIGLRSRELCQGLMGLFGGRTGSSWFLEQNMNSFWNMRHSWSFHVLSQWVCLKLQYYFFLSMGMFEMNIDLDIQSRPKIAANQIKRFYSAKYWSSPKSVWLSPSSQPSKHPTWILKMFKQPTRKCEQIYQSTLIANLKTFKQAKKKNVNKIIRQPSSQIFKMFEQATKKMKLFKRPALQISNNILNQPGVDMSRYVTPRQVQTQQ